MEKYKILVVVPYAGLQELILSMAAEYPQFSFDIIQANLEEALIKLGQINLGEYFAILSRGGTAKLIAQNTDQYVVNIGISGYDIIRLVMLAKNYPGKAVIIGFDSITRRCKMMCELLQASIDIYTIDAASQVADTLDCLDKSSNVLVLGDVISTQIAASKGFTNLLISSGVESVQDALREIQHQSRFIQSRRQQDNLYRALLDSQSPILVFDQKGPILPQSEKNAPLIAHLEKYVEPLLQRGSQSFLVKLESGEQYHATGTVLENPALLGAQRLAVFHTRKIDAKALSFAVSIFGTDDINKSDFNIFIDDNEQVKQALDLAHELAPSNLPVLIEGESGTGKSLLAKIIHTQSNLRDSLLVQLSCSLLGTGELADILDGHLRELLDAGCVTLFLSNLHGLKGTEQLELIRRLPALKKHRLIVSSEKNLFELVRLGALESTLLSAISFHQIWIPPLRLRRKAIQECFYQLLTKMNLRFGKQIVGIERSALELMEAYGWAGNLEQLHYVVSNAVQSESTSYIRKSTVASLLSVYNQASWTRKRFCGQTLKEIEQEIVIATLQEMNMNQSHAAKQLDISRTTLWRILKSANSSPVDLLEE